MNFVEKLSQAIKTNKSLVCLGLDPDVDLIPRGIGIRDFNRAIIDATSDLVCAYKPNLAFYEALGSEGYDILKDTLNHIPCDVPVIGDAKRGDVGSTARLYAQALFETIGFDAATISPYLGYDCVQWFSSYADKGVLVLCHTSNPGATDFQTVQCLSEDSSVTEPLFALVARKAKEWNTNGNVGLVAGATYSESLKQIRGICPDLVLLIPGVGRQGGDLLSAVSFGTDVGRTKTMFASSREILYASDDERFAESARQATDDLRQRINMMLEQLS